MDGKIYFGMKNEMQWVPAPQINMKRGTQRYSKETNFSNGGFNSYRSASGSKVYEMDWGVKSAEDLAHILACYQGLFREPWPGKNLTYFLDPFSMRTNVLPEYWAAPMLIEQGAPNLAGAGKTLTTNTSTIYSYGYPHRRALFGGDGGAVWATATTATLWIPVPNGYTFHFGVHGTTAIGDSINVMPDGGAWAVTTVLGMNTGVMTNYSYTPTGNSGVTLQLRGTDNSILSITGMIAQILPNGEPAPTGNFMPGQGHSGCVFSGDLEDTGLSAALNLQQYSATLKEVGAWQV